MHGFHSGVLAAKILSTFGFPVTEKYHELIHSWSEPAIHAFIAHAGDVVPKPDKQKLPEILVGIDQLFRENAPASLITKTVLLRISLNAGPFYPTPAPLTGDETKRFITPSLLPLLKAMLMGYNEGWSLFDPEERKREYEYILEAFEKAQRLIAG